MFREKDLFRLTSNDGGDALLAQASKHISNAKGALGEFLELEDTHGPVPDDCLALGDHIAKRLDGVWANVKTLHVARSS